METALENALKIFSRYVGVPEEPGAWFLVDQERIDKFADCTLDRQYTHGFLTLSLFSHLVSTLKPPYLDGYAHSVLGVNYGFERVRFGAQVKANSKIRMRRQLKAVEPKSPSALHLIHECCVEIEGKDQPACIAEWIARFVYA